MRKGVPAKDRDAAPPPLPAARDPLEEIFGAALRSADDLSQKAFDFVCKCRLQKLYVETAARWDPSRSSSYALVERAGGELVGGGFDVSTDTFRVLVSACLVLTESLSVIELVEFLRGPPGPAHELTRVIAERDLALALQRVTRYAWNMAMAAETSPAAELVERVRRDALRTNAEIAGRRRRAKTTVHWDPVLLEHDLLYSKLSVQQAAEKLEATSGKGRSVRTIANKLRRHRKESRGR